MCGFAGCVNFKPSDPAAIEAVLASRGPDGRGVYEDEHTWLLHRRLSIIDLDERSNQPFALPDGSVLVYNGELYNHHEFDSALPERTTNGDTEVVAHLGDDPEFVAQFRGMYAYALHRPDGIVHLVRDRFGIKPLYFSVRGKTLMYASQLRCFTNDPVPAQISQQAVASFLRFGCVVTPTMYEGVFELSPGHHLRWRDGVVLGIEPVPALAPASNDLGEVLRQSVERHLVADVPTCVLLSGGLDSAVVAKLAAESSMTTPAAVTLSVGGEIDELDRTKRTAENYGLELHSVVWSDGEVADLVDEFFAAMDQPTIDGLNTFLVCRVVRELGFKVALSGLGADELFGGYAVYKQAGGARLASRLPNPVFRHALSLAGRGLNEAKFERVVDNRTDLVELGRVSRELRTPEKAREMAGVAVATTPRIPTIIDPIQEGEFAHYMRPMLLRDSDAFSMASSVELRVPFLDDDVYALANRRSSADRAFRGKQSIVDALRDPYLQQVFDEPKTGFRLPMAKWFDIQPSAEGEPWSVEWSDRVLAGWTTRRGG
ncbi:MAG: asparagine synthase (glutamine-hydrolyzing) [Acidimicrobiia bacterium]|nr:asparagine synthase (glutamine-hydrolyzing) [Acidimicrobiia bacterium]